MSDNENYSSDENDSDNESEILSEKSEKEDSENEEETIVKKNINTTKKGEDDDEDDDEEDKDEQNNNDKDSDYENDEDDDENVIVEDDNDNEEVEDDDEDIGEDVDEVEQDATVKKGKKTKQTTKPSVQLETSDEEDDDDDDEQYLQKFNSELNKNYIMEHHPECVVNNYDEIASLTTVIRDSNNNIIDDLHRTLPYLTKYERARILGQRAKQINSGAKVFVKVPENIIDGYLIAQMELEQKRIPFIIKRPIPGGGCEYWNLKDLEVVGF